MSKASVKSALLDDYGNLFCTGAFNGTVDFDPARADYTLSTIGSQDAFIHKLSGYVITGIRAEIVETQLGLFPNPTATFINLRTEKPLGAVVCRITDMIGRLALEESLSNGSAFSVDVSSLPGGSYIVELSDGKTRARQKFIKE